MDKNFSDILGIFKKLNESARADQRTMIPQQAKDDAIAKHNEPIIAKRKEAEAKVKADRLKYESKQPQATHSSSCGYNYGHDCDCGLKEGSMTDAEKHQSGSKFGGYWKGTDKSTPKSGMGVGSMEESLRAKWHKFKSQEVDEDDSITAIGATQGQAGTNPTTPPTPAQLAADANKIKQGLTGKLPQGVDASKLSTALATAADTKKPLAGNQAQAVTNTLAPSLAKIAQDPAQANQLGQLIKKAGQQ